MENIKDGELVFNRSGMKVVLCSNGNAYANNHGLDYFYLDDHELVAWKQVNIYPYKDVRTFFENCFPEWFNSLSIEKQEIYMKELEDLKYEMHIPF